MPGHILLRGDNAAVQSLIEQDIRRFRQRLPGRKCPRNLIPRYGLIVGVQVFTRLTFARLAVFNEGLLQQTEVVSFGAEIADMPPGIACFANRHVHFRTGIAVKTVTFHLGGAQV